MVELFDYKIQEKAPKSSDFGAFYGGQYRTRTCDPMHVKHVLIPAELTVHRVCESYYKGYGAVCQEQNKKSAKKQKTEFLRKKIIKTT